MVHATTLKKTMTESLQEAVGQDLVLVPGHQEVVQVVAHLRHWRQQGLGHWQQKSLQIVRVLDQEPMARDVVETVGTLTTAEARLQEVVRIDTKEARA
jgi:hypothetical protein